MLQERVRGHLILIQLDIHWKALEYDFFFKLLPLLIPYQKY